MPDAAAAPSVTLSFANNFWGKDDAGVSPLLERMHNAKVTGDELKSFYTARAALEDEYARKLLSLARKPLGSSEAGTLRMSLDVVRGEVESMGKAHQHIAHQMKTELDEQLTAFTGGMKERRKIVQNGIEKLLKTKTQQTMVVNKARDKYEQDCLKIKGYLAQGHMVMGQEERKNKAKLEKTQIQLSATSNEYEAAVKVLEETTGRWNRDWKAACDKFQDLEEERIDFMKSSLWGFANIASTVCVSDDASCEKIRLSLEDLEVEKDITGFIRECGTGQEIPDPPKFINFCRDDLGDGSDIEDDGSYSVAQFQRTMNPAFRSSSPQPSTYESHHDPQRDLDDSMHSAVSNTSATPRKTIPASAPKPFEHPPTSTTAATQQAYIKANKEAIPEVPHNEYPMDGMTQFCRIGPPSDLSSAASPARPGSRDSQSSNPTSFTSQEPSLIGSHSPIKQMSEVSSTSASDIDAQKKRSGFFQNRSPFRRKSKGERDRPLASRSTWAPSTTRTEPDSSDSPTRQPPGYSTQQNHIIHPGQRVSASPEPVDPRASFQLNVGNNVFDVATPDARNKRLPLTKPLNELDPIAQALAELKGVGKQSSVRMSVDRYAGTGTPAPSTSPNKAANTTPSRPFASTLQSGKIATPPPSYDQAPVSRLGAPQPAFTSKQMQQTTQKYVDQKQNMFSSSSSRYNTYDSPRSQTQQRSPQSRPDTGSGSGRPHSRATSPAPFRSTSPRPGLNEYQAQPGPVRAVSPNPYTVSGGSNGTRPRAHSTSPMKQQGGFTGGQGMPRARSPRPQFDTMQTERPISRNENSAIQLAPVNAPQMSHDAQRGRPNGAVRPMSYYAANGNPNTTTRPDQRVRSKSAADGRQFTKDGRPILHFSRAMYMYQAAIPEELSFSKGDVLAILRHQDDGWWEAEVVGKRGRPVRGKMK